VLLLLLLLLTELDFEIFGMEGILLEELNFDELSEDGIGGIPCNFLELTSSNSRIGISTVYSPNSFLSLRFKRIFPNLSMEITPIRTIGIEGNEACGIPEE